MDTRSRREQASQRPAYPSLTTTTTVDTSPSSASSAFQSSSSLMSIQSANSSTMPSQQASSAPLPSPLVQQSTNYFGSISAAAVPQQQVRHTSSSQVPTYVGQRGDGGGAPETMPYLDNFNLVAEAAKRAQMACLMRDLGDVEL